MKDIHPKLKLKLDATKKEYAKVTEFAKVLPLFASHIIDCEFTGDRYCRL